MLVNLVSPDSPISPNDGHCDSQFADEERGSQRMVTQQGGADLRWQPRWRGLQRPCCSCCPRLPRSAFLRLLQAHLGCMPPPSPGAPKPPRSLSPVCQVHPSLSPQGGRHGSEPSPAASITRALPPHQGHLPPQNSPMEALVHLKVLDTQKLVSLGQGVCPACETAQSNAGWRGDIWAQRAFGLSGSRSEMLLLKQEHHFLLERES